VVEPQKVESFGASGEVHDPGLVGVQSQPERGQDRRRQLAGRVGLLAGGADDDQVVGVSDQHSQPPPAAVPCPVEDMQGDVGEQW
jgi:hypothetical protein